MPERIIVVEDDRELRSLLVELIGRAEFEAVPFDTAAPALAKLQAGEPADLVITDRVLPGMLGDDLLRQLRLVRPEINVIVITAFGSIDSAIELIRAGAFDYVTKPFTNEQIMTTIHQALEESRVRRTLADLKREDGGPLAGFVGQSPGVREMLALASRAGKSRHPVLITGESGTGKEILARGIHTLSGRERFVAINCGALAETLIESELFGHERGAFTGADRAREGLLETAHRGTAFLDEIGELPPQLQPRLLRALEQGEIRRVGSNETRSLDFRLIAATNRDLEADMRSGRFREDLYWRINVIAIAIPPLRDRASDIPLLVEHFLQDVARESHAPLLGITEDALALLESYPWPGNVRELRNAVQRAAVLTTTSEIRPRDLPPRIFEQTRLSHRPTPSKGSLRELERAYILEVLQDVDGNKSKAADILGVDRKTLYRKLEEYRAEGDVSLPD
jgi:DNA-binding NtrC family response regulator